MMVNNSINIIPETVFFIFIFPFFRSLSALPLA